MSEEFKEQLIKGVTDAVAADVLTDYDAIAIIAVCRNATERKIANLTELYMINAIGGEVQ